MNERIAAFAEMCKEVGFSESEIAEYVQVANQAAQEFADQDLAYEEADYQEYLRQVREGLQPPMTQAELGEQPHQPEPIQPQHAELQYPDFPHPEAQHSESQAQYDETHSQPEKTPLCNHLFAATPSEPAHLCGSPALRGEPFCYFHHPTRKPLREPHERRARRIARQSFNFRIPTTRRELQFSLDAVASRIASNQIDLRRASQLLYALQMAERNM
jgi:hypothetical protein